jgi:hypothetical protein
VEYLYETAVWTQAHGSRRDGRRLPTRGITLLNETGRALAKIGAPAVVPLVDSVRLYETFGPLDDDVRFLYFTVVFDVLEKMGRVAADGLRELIESRDSSVRVPAKRVLRRLQKRGLLDDDGRDD